MLQMQERYCETTQPNDRNHAAQRPEPRSSLSVRCVVSRTSMRGYKKPRWFSYHRGFCFSEKQFYYTIKAATNAKIA